MATSSTVTSRRLFFFPAHCHCHVRTRRPRTATATDPFMVTACRMALEDAVVCVKDAGTKLAADNPDAPMAVQVRVTRVLNWQLYENPMHDTFVAARQLRSPRRTVTSLYLGQPYGGRALAWMECGLLRVTMHPLELCFFQISSPSPLPPHGCDLAVPSVPCCPGRLARSRAGAYRSPASFGLALSRTT